MAVKRIEHFMLPEHHNRLYTEEAVSSVALARDVANKVNELVDAYNELNEWQLAKHQEQDGTIRKGVLFMKDNLLNSLNDLLNLLQSQGYFEEQVKIHTIELVARLDNLLSTLTNSGGEIDAEVLDGRVAEFGATYATLGTAIREQMRGKVSIDGVQEVTPRNLQIIDIVNPNFFDMTTALFTPIYGAFSNDNFIRKTKNTAVLMYNAGAQFSIEIDNTNKTDVFISIEATKPLYWVRLTDSATSTQGSTLGSKTKTIKTNRNITTAKYLVFYVEPETEITVHVNEGTTETAYKMKAEYLPNTSIVNTWENKRVICLGDSITANTNSWINGLKNNLALSEIVNAGVGGTTISDVVENYFASRVNESFANYDCVFVMGGTNDEGQNVRIGDSEYNNGFKKSTFKGAIADLIKTIQTNAPNAKIIFCTPLAGRGKAGENANTPQKNGQGLTTADYAKAMREVCELYSIPCIDLYGECGITPFNRTTYIADTVHPNQAGQDKILNVLTNGFVRHKF